MIYVYKSNYFDKDCAAAIKLSLKKLTMAGLDRSMFVIHVITADSGGDDQRE